MIDWVLPLAGGLLGSAHCVGMCGSFVITLGIRGRSWTANLVPQLLYGVGRIFTYSVMGAMAGLAGKQLVGRGSAWPWLQAGLSLVAGVALLAMGLVSAGWVPLPQRARTGAACLGPALFGSLYQATRQASTFLAGVLNGLLPCGLVYAYLTLAVSTSTPGRGAVTMLVFGLGTLPALVALGSGATYLGCTGKRRLLHLSAWCVLATGLLTLVRGVQALPWFQSDCPFCG